VFQKVGNWLTDRNDRSIHGGAGPSEGYYGSSEAEHVYGRMGGENSEKMDNYQDSQAESRRYQSADPFNQADKYDGRVPYRSQKDILAQQTSMEVERQRQLREEQVKGYTSHQSSMYPPIQQTQQPYSSQMPPPLQSSSTPLQTQGFPAQTSQISGHTPQKQMQHNNVVMFPGMLPTPEGNICTHMEYIVLLRSRNECKNVIEYIKANASVFLNMEFIASDTERQRCVDMLSGAAYTLGCHLHKISPRGIYLISSPSVYVVIDPAMQKFASAPEPQSYTQASYEANYEAHRQMGGYQSSAHAPGMSEALHQFRNPVTPTTHPDRYSQQTQSYQRGMSPTFENVKVSNAARSNPY